MTKLERNLKRGGSSDATILGDGCRESWLATAEATRALSVKKSMVDKYAQRELRYIYYSLREGLHIEGYYDGSSGFDEV